ncbi:MAG TPA: PLP-dependent aminotransferase family protein [Solirubrobacteraceae bacterium]|jgi:DNA-binding transcriptional MocR family regulator
MSYKFDLLHINRGSASSLNEQLVTAVRSAIENGELVGGDRLPTTRALAEQAGVNHLTAVRAYRRLAELGYVTASVGRGTFVRAVPPPAAASGDRWQHAVLPDVPRSYVNQVVADTWQAPGAHDTVNLATGWASSELHPFAELRSLADRVFAEEGPGALMYGDPDGLWPLREELARRGVADGFAADSDEILVTSGARQAIDLVCRAILSPGDVAVSESPTFTGALASLQNTGARVLGVPYGRDGLDVEALEAILAHHEVKLVVVQTASQNPTGQDLASDRAERLLELARERSFFVLEDAVYATVRFDGPGPQRLRMRAPDHVIYVDSLSKTIGGGLRLGWLAATGELRRRLTDMKLASDYHTAILVQHLAHRWLLSGSHERHIARVNPVYAGRAAALVDALERRLADELRPLRPRGGHHVWAEFTRPVDERLLVAEALRNGVSFTPGGATRPEPGGSGGLRLSFSLLDEEMIDEGIRRLAVALREVRRTRSHTHIGAAMS